MSHKIPFINHPWRAPFKVEGLPDNQSSWDYYGHKEYRYKAMMKRKYAKEEADNVTANIIEGIS